MTVNLTVLCNKVAAAQPGMAYHLIAKAITKLRKLATTISNRERDRRLGHIDDLVGFDNHTEYFYSKAYKIAHDIGCDFVASPETAQYWVRIDNQLERIV